jgi:hypothetical protein
MDAKDVTLLHKMIARNVMKIISNYIIKNAEEEPDIIIN